MYMDCAYSTCMHKMAFHDDWWGAKRCCTANVDPGDDKLKIGS